MILLLSLLATAASASRLIEHFECGSPSFLGSTTAARWSIRWCNDAVIDDANLCCKEHDLCYDVHSLRNYTRDYCDTRFCNCLKDVSDRSKNYECKDPLDTFCRLVKGGGQGAFNRATPPDTLLKYADFVDERPLGVDFWSLVNACEHSKGLAVHCHNTVHTCLQGKHERFRRLVDVVEHSYEDCRSTMYDCMQMIIESETSESCSSIARSIAKQANTYMELDETKHGRSIMETYPVVAARLIKQCNQSTIEPCLLSFHTCALVNRQDRPEVYNAARKIKDECHHELRSCLSTATAHENSEDCIEARNLAVGRIRSKDLDQEKTGILNEFGSLLDGLGIKRSN